MPQSLGRIYLHTVFATKNREPFIIMPAPPRLHGYLVAVLGELGCPSLATGGIEDHVHILHALGRTRSVAWVMEGEAEIAFVALDERAGGSGVLVAAGVRCLLGGTRRAGACQALHPRPA